MSSEHPVISIRGARVHNLQGVDLDLDAAGLTVLVGPSGSGKSSLALDVLHAASRARLARALGLDARAQVDVGAVGNLPVTVAASERHRPAASARVADVLGLTPAMVAAAMAGGVQHCPACARPLPTATADQMVDRLLEQPEGARLTLLAPVVRARVGGVDALLSEVARQGFVRVRLDGALRRLEDVGVLDARAPHDVDVVVDRLKLGPDRRERLEEALGTALAAGKGRAVALVDDQELLLLARPWCPDHPQLDLEPMQAEWLAGSPAGRCPACAGSGRAQDQDQEHVQPCPACQGVGLRPEVAHWVVGADATPWPQVQQAPLHALPGLLAGLPAGRPAAPRPASGGPLDQVAHHVQLAAQVGLDGLPGDRTVAELSDTELRRLTAVATHELARGIPGALLVLDESTAGLTPDALEQFAAFLGQGSVRTLAVTHDRAIVDRAAHCLAFGPGAGRRGGTVVWQGPGRDLPQALLPSPVAARVPPSPPDDVAAIRIAGARGAVLAAADGGVNAAFPHGALTVVTGPPASGKSSLVSGTLLPAARRALGLVADDPLPHDGLSGMEPFSQLLSFDRSPLGRSARSCVATVLGLWSPLRELLAATRDARILGIDAQRFRFDQPGGRCEACQGTGQQQRAVVGPGSTEARDAFETCPVCDGHRFQQDTLRVRLKGRTVAELLDSDVEEARGLFAMHRKLGPALTAATLVGLGYLPLGQPSATLSGGEAQRLRLARELARAGGVGVGDARRLDDRLILLDAPTVGLHPHDVAAVVEVLRRLADRGATVVVATVEPALVSAADYAVGLSWPRPSLRRSSP